MATPASPTPSVSGRSLLVKWVLTQDTWIREVTAAVLETGKELSDAQIDEAYQTLLVEKGLEPGEALRPLELTETGAAGAAEASLTVISIDCVKRVNLLAEAQTITFSSKLTVLFGRNGSGKTGYVRILRCLASARREEPVLPDITAATPTTDPPECRVRYALGNAEQQPPYQWHGEAGVPPFTRMDVFDAQDARTYVDSELTYLYTPADVALFRYVSLAIEGVRSRLDAARKAKAPGQNLFAAQFPREVSFYSRIDGLGASTDTSALKKLADVSPEDEASLPSLRETVAALGSQSVHTQVQAAQAELDVFTRAKVVAEQVLGFDVKALNDALAAVTAAEAKRTAATQAAFADDHLPGFLSNEWRAFIEAGEDYLKSLGLADYPSADAPCAYCRQPLTSAAVKLIHKYREFSTDTLERAVSEARETFEHHRHPLLATDLNDLQQLIERQESALPAGTAPGAGLVAARRVLSTARALQDELCRDAPIAADVVPVDIPAIARAVSDSASEMSQRLQALRGQVQERERLLKEATAQKVLLEARLTLHGLMGSIEAYVDRAKWVDLAGTVLKKLQSSAKTLTETSNLASERLMNEGFEKHFREECQRLSAPVVSLDFHGRKGQAARRKLLRPEYKLSDTLSEGEQKVIALADFLAEARLRATNAPVIFDDPVTSLDYERLGEVASRLAYLANERQVIVFTHNIWFAAELLEKFRDRKKDCAYFDVRTVEGRKGIVSGGTHPRTDSLSDLRKRINTVIADAKKASGESQDALIFRGYSLLRSLCEVAAETELLCGVVRRYEPNIMLTRLPDIKPAALKAAGDLIYPVYETTCRFIDSHSQPLEHLNIVRTVDELDKDFRTVLDAIGAYHKAAA